MKKILICLFLLISSCSYAGFNYCKDGVRYENCKIELLREYGGLVIFEGKIQTFCDGKEIVDIKVTSNKDDSTTVIIIYK